MSIVKWYRRKNKKIELLEQILELLKYLIERAEGWR
jgi:hypothetical protein